MVLTLIAWAAIVTSAQMVSYDLQTKTWHSWLTFSFHIIAESHGDITKTSTFVELNIVTIRYLWRHKINGFMKHRLPLLILYSIFVITAMAQSETTDSIKTQELDEIVVEASNQRINAEVSTYIPMARQKNAAQNAVSLLSMMSIPQISVDPVSQAVQTAHGQNVSIFIDYLPATAEDLSGMRTQDVKKVEYFMHPSDARFQGAKYVINFVMQKYEWGGYTKLSAEKSFGVNSTGASVYSKMKYKRMTFDIFADENYLTNRHIGQNSVEHFKFTDLYGNGPQDITRTSETKSSLYRNNSNDISLRAYYNSENFQFSNRIAYSLANTPHNDLRNSLSYSSDLLPMSESFTDASSRDWALTYNGSYFFMLSQLAALNLDANYTYGNNKSNSHYYVPDDLSIINNAHEDVHKFDVYLHFNWNPTKANQFFTNVGVQHSWNIINYLGNSPSKQNYHVGVYFLSQNYQHIFNEHWNVGGSMGWIWETNRISGVKVDNTYPQTNINATWSPNDKNQLYLTANYGSMSPDASQKSPNMLQQDELMWYRGTPELKDYKYTNALLSYTWLPNNKWQLSADGYFGLIKNRCVTPIFSYRPRWNNVASVLQWRKLLQQLHRNKCHRQILERKTDCQTAAPVLDSQDHRRLRMEQQPVDLHSSVDLLFG